MTRTLTAIALWLATLTAALAQGGVANFPQTLPSNSVVGRLGATGGPPGPSQAITFDQLAGRMHSVRGPTSAVLGTIPFWDNTTGSLLGGAPQFRAGNPGNAALYNALANPANGYTTLYNGMQFSLGTPIPASEQYGNGTLPIQQAFVATGTIAAGDVGLGNILSGYCRADAPDPAICVGIFGQSGTSVNGSNIFGANGIAQNIHAPSTAGFNVNYLAGVEFNPNFWQISAGVNPTASQNHFYGINIQGGGNHTNEIGSAIVINNSAFPATTRWANGVELIAGCCVTGVSVGPLALGNSQPSQPVVLRGTNAGGLARAGQMQVDLDGNVVLKPFAAGLIALADPSAGTILSTSSSYGGSGVRISALTTNGILTNDTNGQVTSTPSLAVTLGGTGQSTYTLGDMLYSSATNTLSKLAGNTTSGKQFLSQTGTGTISAAPAWATISGADITGAALTKTDDTNVTLTLGGTPATALLKAASLTLGWTGTLANSRLATMATNTVKGNTTSGTASPADLAVGSCSTASSALIWTTNTGFGCNTSITAADVANAAVIAKVLTGFTSGAGTVSAADSILSALQKINGNDALKAPIASPIFTGTATIPTLAATTINAFTLAGTVAGGGNQINNVIIGSSTPLAGSFTTVSASTSVTSPLHIGGSGTTGTQLTFQTTSGVGTTDTFAFKGGNNGATTFATLGNGGLNLPSGSTYSINNTLVLSSASLGSGIVGSSLTSLGTLSSLTVSGAVSLTNNAAGGQLFGGTSSDTGQTYFQFGNTSVGGHSWQFATAGSTIGVEVGGFYFYDTTAGKYRALFSQAGNTVIGSYIGPALATTATDGFIYIPTSAGTPTGVPTAYTGHVALLYDTTNHQFWIYDGGWKQPKTPAAAALVTWQ